MNEIRNERMKHMWGTKWLLNNGNWQKRGKSDIARMRKKWENEECFPFSLIT